MKDLSGRRRHVEIQKLFYVYVFNALHWLNIQKLHVYIKSLSSSNLETIFLTFERKPAKDSSEPINILFFGENETSVVSTIRVVKNTHAHLKTVENAC